MNMQMPMRSASSHTRSMWLISLRAARLERFALDALVFTGAMRSTLVARAGRLGVARAMGRRADDFAAAFFAGAFALAGALRADDRAAAALAAGFLREGDFAVA